MSAMSGRGGIYTGPDGQQLHGDGKPVASPRSELETNSQAGPLCHCGKPLHYTDPAIQAKVEALIAQHGENVQVIIGGKTYLVPRHYIALHGLVAREVPDLGFQILGT